VLIPMLGEVQGWTAPPNQHCEFTRRP
jgi:hypothetical protein